VSQIITIDRDGSLDRVAAKMRLLYREAESHGTFVNLDMEEYRDLELTVTAFKRDPRRSRVLGVAAGIVAPGPTCPNPTAAFADLVEWSASRFHTLGGTLRSDW